MYVPNDACKMVIPYNTRQQIEMSRTFLPDSGGPARRRQKDSRLRTSNPFKQNILFLKNFNHKTNDAAQSKGALLRPFSCIPLLHLPNEPRQSVHLKFLFQTCFRH